MVVGGRGSLTLILQAVQGDDLGCERVEFERGWERVGEGGRGRGGWDKVVEDGKRGRGWGGRKRVGDSWRGWKRVEEGGRGWERVGEGGRWWE